MVLIMGFLIYMFVETELKKEQPHHHVKAAHYITRFKAVPVTWCFDEDKIVAHNGEHISIKVPVVLYPNMEAVE